MRLGKTLLVVGNVGIVDLVGRNEVMHGTQFRELPSQIVVPLDGRPEEQSSRRGAHHDHSGREGDEAENDFQVVAE